jgi:hypothetical protein
MFQDLIMNFTLLGIAIKVQRNSKQLIASKGRTQIEKIN